MLLGRYEIVVLVACYVHSEILHVLCITQKFLGSNLKRLILHSKISTSKKRFTINIFTIGVKKVVISDRILCSNSQHQRYILGYLVNY